MQQAVKTWCTTNTNTTATATATNTTFSFRLIVYIFGINTDYARSPRKNMGTDAGFYRLEALPITQPTKHQRKN